MYSQLISVLARAEASAAAGEQGDVSGMYLSSVIVMAAVMAIMYFFMIRPQKKKEKEAKEMRDNLQIGDEVTTIGGITGIVVRKTEDTVVIETGGDRSKIRVKTWAISENATVHDAVEETVKKK